MPLLKLVIRHGKVMLVPREGISTIETEQTIRIYKESDKKKDD